MHAWANAGRDGSEPSHHAMLVGIHDVEAGEKVGAQRNEGEQANPVAPPARP
jgi:hypothetical protein